jgi:hypothetical protein
MPRAIELLKAQPDIDDVAPFGPRIRVAASDGADLRALCRDVLTEAGIEILRASEDSPTVEDAFVAVVHSESGSSRGAHS